MNFIRIGLLFFAFCVENSVMAQGLSPLPPIRQNLPNVFNKDFSSENNKQLAQNRINHIKGALNLKPELLSEWQSFAKVLLEFETTQLNHSSELALVRANIPAEAMKISARQKREIADKQEDVALSLQRFLDVLAEPQKRKLISFLPKTLK